LNEPTSVASGAFAAGGARNYFSYNSPRFEAALESERAEVDPSRRRDLVFEAQRVLLDERPLAAFTAWFLTVQMGLRREVRGAKFGGNGPTGVNAGEEAYQGKSIWLDQ
jgi:ABC-type transport system substrate-binding protein